MIKTAKYFFISLFLISFDIVYSQEFNYKNFGTAQGIPSSETYKVFQDSKGFIWVTSDAGICRYDGISFTTFATKDGISESVVFGIREDRHGRIWFNTLSGYFFYYENGVFHEIASNSKLKKLCKRFPAISFFIGENDTLYCSALYTPGLVKIPPQENYKNIIIERLPLCNLFLITNKLNNSELVVCQNDTIKFDLSRPTATTKVYLFNTKKSYSLKWKLGEVCSIGLKTTISGDHTLFCQYAKQLRALNLINEKVEYYDFSQTIISIYVDSENNLWVGTYKGGGYFFKNSDLKSKPIHFLPKLSPTSFFVDREGSVWITTLEKGVFQVVNRHLLGWKSEGDLEGDYVMDFFKSKSLLFMGFYQKKEGTIFKNDSLFILSNQLRSISVGNFQSICKGESYSYYGFSTGTFFNYKQKFTEIYPGENRHISGKKIIEISPDTCIILSNFDLFVVNKEKILRRIRPPYTVSTIIQLKNKTILTGSRNNEGIYEYKNGSFIPYLKQYPQLKVRINCIEQDKKENLWIATNERGVFCYANGKLYEFNENNGLPSNKANSLSFDKNGNVWIATNKGLCKINFKKGMQKPLISSFNKTHGIPNLEIDKLVEFNGRIWCATKEWLFYFNIDEMNLNVVPPLTYIQSVFVNNKPTDIYASPVLSYDQNNIEFEYGGITYKDQEQKDYMYKLEGYDNEWTHSSNTKQVRYMNLAHGTYKFMVHALNNDKIKGDKPAVFEFIIKRPYWLTWWFVALEAMVVIALVWAIINWRISIIRKQERERTQVNQKLADFQMTAIRAQMNPHFIFNAISSIQNYILKSDVYQSYSYLSKFALLIRNVLDNSKEEYISLEKEINSLNLYIELEQLRFKEAFESRVHIDAELDTENTYVPTMFIQPYIENAIWHGLMPKQKDAKLWLSMKQNDDTLIIVIRDNGIGRQQSEKHKTSTKHKSKGMMLIEERLRSLETKNNRKYSVTIKDLMDEDAQPAGTEVTIVIPLLFD